MSARRIIGITSLVFGVVAIVAVVIWLGSRSDEALSRWSAIAGVISGVFTVLGFAFAVIPLWRHDNDGDVKPGMEPQKPAEATTITQEFSNSGDAYGVGQGTLNVHHHPPADSPRDGQGGR